MRLRFTATLVALLLLGACDGDVEPGDGAAGPGQGVAAEAGEAVGEPLDGEEEASASEVEERGSGDDSSISGVTRVTVTSFVLQEDGTYSPKGTPLTFEVGVPCQTWEREAPGDDINPEDGHLHYNAASDVAFDGTTLTWTEFGPEHDEGVVAPLCESGQGGAPKSATSDDYTPATNSPNNKAYLKVSAVE